jgi:hypothetical protein
MRARSRSRQAISEWSGLAGGPLDPVRAPRAPGPGPRTASPALAGQIHAQVTRAPPGRTQAGESLQGQVKRTGDRWTGTITIGWKPDGRRDRITVRGRTKTEVKDKLRAKHTELAAGVRTPANCTVEQCLKDWLETLNAQAESTVTGYRSMVRHLVELLGNVKLVELKVRDVDLALGELAKRLSTRSVRLARMILIQAIRNAMVNDLVARNVADLAAVPTGKPGRPSRSPNLDQALAVLDQDLDWSND